MADYPTTWFWRSLPLNGDWFAVQSFTTDEFSKPSTIDLDNKPTLADPYSTIELENGHLKVWIDKTPAPNIPNLWYLILPESKAPRPSTFSLVAFADDRFPDGYVLNAEQFRKFGRSTIDQVAAIRWERKSGKLQQIYVNKSYRRQGISFGLLNVADIIHVAGGALTHPYGGEEVTPDGAKLAEAWQHSPRVRSSVATFSPMD